MTMQKSALKRFETSTGPDGQKWTPLHRKTIQRKCGENKATPLIDHGNLIGAIHCQIAGDTVCVGTDDKRAAVHQLGWTLKISAQTRTQTAKLGTKGNAKGRFIKKRSPAPPNTSSTRPSPLPSPPTRCRCLPGHSRA